ncbi:MAG: ABC transporter permease, partial [Actinoplanes sp.]
RRAPAPGRRVRAALHAEWTKLCTTPGPAVTLMLTAALTVAAGAVAAAAGDGAPDPVRLSLTGVHLAQMMVAAAGVQLLAGEHGTGLIQVTFTAVPRRGAVYAAKALLLTTGIAATAAVAVAGSLLAGHLLLDGFSGAVLRPAAGAMLYLCLIALLGLGAGALLRDTAAAIGLVLNLLLTPVVLQALPDQDWQTWLFRLSPSTAGQVAQATVGVPGMPIGPWAGLAVTAGWAFASVALGGLLLCRRDA